MNHFPFLFLWKSFMGFLPSFRFGRARHDPNADPEMSARVGRRGCTFLRGFGVKDWPRSKKMRGGEPGSPRTNKQDAREEGPRQPGCYFEGGGLIEFALESYRILIGKQALNDRGVFD